MITTENFLGISSGRSPGNVIIGDISHDVVREVSLGNVFAYCSNFGENSRPTRDVAWVKLPHE